MCLDTQPKQGENNKGLEKYDRSILKCETCFIRNEIQARLELGLTIKGIVIRVVIFVKVMKGH